MLPSYDGIYLECRSAWWRIEPATGHRSIHACAVCHSWPTPVFGGPSPGGGPVNRAPAHVGAPPDRVWWSPFHYVRCSSASHSVEAMGWLDNLEDARRLPSSTSRLAQRPIGGTSWCLSTRSAKSASSSSARHERRGAREHNMKRRRREDREDSARGPVTITQGEST